MIPKVLKNFNLFANDKSYAGKGEDLTLPKLTKKTEEFRAGGLDAPISIDMGMEEFQASFTLVEYDKDILKQFGLVDGNAVLLTFKGASQDDTNVSPMVVKLRGMYKEIDMGKVTAGEIAKMQCTILGRYYYLEIDGEELIEIDVPNMTRVIGGKDQMAEIRKALGM